MKQLWRHSLAQGLIVSLLYYGAARLGLLMAFKQTNASPVWIASGLAVAAVLWRGYAIVPFLALAAFAANGLTFVSYGVELPQAAALSVLIAVGNILEALICAFWLGRVAEAAQLLNHPRGVLRFVTAAAVGSMVAATMATIGLGLGSAMAWRDTALVWVTWWMGDVAGILLVTPLLLTWRRPIRVTGAQRLEALLLLILLPLVSLLVFGVWPLLASLYPLSYLIMPFLVWAVFRFGQHGATLAMLLTSSVAVWGTTHGTGPLWVAHDVHQSLLLLQTFMGVVTMTVLMTSAALIERAQARDALQQARDALEVRVMQRTAALQDANSNLAASNEQLQASNEELQHLQTLRDNLTHMIVHDLRTPLHALDYALQTLAAQPQLTSNMQGAVQLSLQSSRGLSNLISNLLDLHMQEAGALHLQWQVVAPHVLVEASVTQIVWLAAYKKVRLTTTVVPTLPQMHGDFDKLARALSQFAG